MDSFFSVLLIAAMACGQFGQQVFNNTGGCANGQCSQQAAPQRIVQRQVTRQSTPVVRQAIQRVAQVPIRAVGAVQQRISQPHQSGCNGQAVRASNGCAGGQSQAYTVVSDSGYDIRPGERLLAPGEVCGTAMPATCGNSPIQSVQYCQSETILSCSVQQACQTQQTACQTQQTACQTHAQAAYGFTDPAYAVAHASATYRAQNGIKGHCSIERGHTAGVGYASNNPNPRTCFNESRGAYAVVRGRDGWYATKIVR